ncbi:hypothetical protein J4Q44_G00265480 [Coregonus suidteri]|uniref:Uncharacterized protein n=1 Tax=Coregonus suidteri TaxID=861788 RepID=A0AAN8QLI1_9TELE
MPFKSKKYVMLKSSPADQVTETDNRVEKMLISAIRDKYPTHKHRVRHDVKEGYRSEQLGRSQSDRTGGPGLPLYL